MPAARIFVKQEEMDFMGPHSHQLTQLRDSATSDARWDLLPDLRATLNIPLKKAGLREPPFADRRRGFFIGACGLPDGENMSSDWNKTEPRWCMAGIPPLANNEDVRGIF